MAMGPYGQSGNGTRKKVIMPVAKAAQKKPASGGTGKEGAFTRIPTADKRYDVQPKSVNVPDPAPGAADWARKNPEAYRQNLNTQAANAGNYPGAGNPGESYGGLAGQQVGTNIPIAFSQPELILANQMRQMGMQPYGANNALMNAGQPQMDALNALVPLIFGNTGASNGDIYNWMAKMGGQAISPGGQMIDLHNVLGMLGGVKPLNADGSPSAIGGLLASGGQQDQVRAMRDMIYAGSVNQHPGMQAAIQAAYQNLANQWLTDSISGKGAPNFLQRVNQSSTFQPWR